MKLLLFILSFFHSNGTLTVTILNFKNDLGQVIVALYNKEEGFPKSPDKAVKIIHSPDQG